MNEVELVINQFILEEGKLYTLPELYQQLEEKIYSDTVSIDEIASLINTDAALSAKVLKLANSPLYGFRAEINTLQRALTLIGTKEVRNLILMDTITHNFNQGSSYAILKMEDFWTRSVYIALISKRMAKKLKHPEVDRLFVSGIMSRIGQLVSCTTRCNEVLKVLNETLSFPLMDEFTIEVEHLGFNYNQVSAELLHRWHVPDEITLALDHIHSPLDLPEDLDPRTILDIYILHVASIYSHLLEHEDANMTADLIKPADEVMSDDINKYIDHVSPKINKLLAIDRKFIDDILFEIEMDALEILNIVFPKSTSIY